MKKFFVEGICTAILIFVGCLCASLGYETLGITGVALSFGLAYILCYYTLGKLSVCHLNPVVSFASLLANRMNFKDFWFYILSQFVGAIVGAVLVFIMITMSPDAASLLLRPTWLNSFAELSQSQISIIGTLILEIILTAVFVFVFIHNTFSKDKKRYAGILIGLAYVLVTLLGFSLTGACINPARCFGPALISTLFAGFGYLAQFPLFLIATLLGSLLAVILYRVFFKEECGDLIVPWLNFGK